MTTKIEIGEYKVNIQEWANNLIQSVDQYWSTHPELVSGYSVFYSPVKAKPHLLIIGLQPGGGPESFDRNAAKTIPQKHEYLAENYLMAKKMVALFAGTKFELQLPGSVKTNLNFFRAKNNVEWKQIDLSLRQDVAKFCSQKVKDIIETLQPETILCEGISTYEAVKELLSKEVLKEIRTKNAENKTLFLSSTVGGQRLLGIPHPTGSFGLTTEDWAVIKSKIV